MTAETAIVPAASLTEVESRRLDGTKTWLIVAENRMGL